MARGRLPVAVGLLLASIVPAHAWMTFVARNVDTGERLGLGASADLEDEAPVLSLLCLPDGLTATFDTGLEPTGANLPPGEPVSFFIAGDGEPYDPFPATAELTIRGESEQVRLRLSAYEARGLAEYVLSTAGYLDVSYRPNGEERLHIRFPNDGATVAIGAVLAECAARHKASSKG